MPILEIKGFKKSFGKTQVLNGVDFSMDEGEVLSVIGSSGSGKTTLLRCINFLERADEGEIYLDGELLFSGEDKAKLSAAEMRKKQLNFGLVFQDFNLFPQYSVLENVTLAPKLLAKEQPNFKADKKEILAQIDENAKAVLASVGLSDKLNSYPCELSGGQKQRVSIARIFLKNPPIMILDEATSALDNVTENEIQKSLEELGKNRTNLVVAHRLSTIKNADEIIVLTENGIEERGTHQELVEKNGIYSKLNKK